MRWPQTIILLVWVAAVAIGAEDAPRATRRRVTSSTFPTTTNEGRTTRRRVRSSLTTQRITETSLTSLTTRARTSPSSTEAITTTSKPLRFVQHNCPFGFKWHPIKRQCMRIEKVRSIKRAKTPEDKATGDAFFSLTPEVLPKPKPKPLGMENKIIPDKAIKASSSALGSSPLYARGNSGNAWVPARVDKRPYLQVDLQQRMSIFGIGTQGHPGKSYWTKSFLLQLSGSGNTWFTMKNKKGKSRVFKANVDNRNWQRHSLQAYYGEAPKAQAVRIRPISFHKKAAIRMELYGFRGAEDRNLLRVLRKDAWTRSVKGCRCYFDPRRTDCACCHPGGCQCPIGTHHQCVQCGYGAQCGLPEIQAVDTWTQRKTGCKCLYDRSRYDCACCQRLGCPCGWKHRNQCVQCGHPDTCGMKPIIFGRPRV